MQTFSELLSQVRDIDEKVRKTRAAPLTTPEAFAAIAYAFAGLQHVAGAAAASNSLLSEEELEVHLSALVTAALLGLSGLFPEFGLGLSGNPADVTSKPNDKLLAMVVEMRKAQRQFFSTKDREALIRSKSLEASIDKMLAEV